MTFDQWFYSEQHRAKYTNDSPAYLAAQEAWGVNVSTRDTESIIDERLARLRRMYKLDSKMSDYHRIRELELIRAKIRKEKLNATRQKPNRSAVPQDDK